MNEKPKRVAIHLRPFSRVMALCVIAAVSSSIALSGSVVHADTSDVVSVDEASAAITSVRETSSDLVHRSELVPEDDIFVLDEDGGDKVVVSSDADDGTSISTSAGVDVAITFGDADHFEEAEIDTAGVVSYPGKSSYAASVGASEDGVQFLTTIFDDEAPIIYAYDLELPLGAVIEIDERSGGVTARTPEGDLLVLVAPPWAIDAAGVAIETHFEVQGSRLTQVVEHRSTGVSYPVVADPTVSGHLIQKYKWVKDGTGWKISVAVTAAMGWALSSAAGIDGWSELAKAVKKNSVAEYNRLNTATMQHQWICHAIGKAAIGIGGWLGIDKSPTWDLETHRRPLSGDIWAIAGTMVSSRCNW